MAVVLEKFVVYGNVEGLRLVTSEGGQEFDNPARYIYISRAKGSEHAEAKELFKSYEDVLNSDPVPPLKYLKFDGKVLSEKTAEEKAVYDAAELMAKKIDKIKAWAQQVTNFVEAKYNPSQQNTILALQVDAMTRGMTNRAEYFNLLTVWVNDQILEYYYKKQDEIYVAPDLEAMAAITFDLNQFHASDPGTKIRTGRAIPD